MKQQETTKTVIKTTTTNKLRSYKTEPKQQQQNRLRWLNMLKCFFLFIKKKGTNSLVKRKELKRKQKLKLKHTIKGINFCEY